jgi:hypothetical protein
MNLIDITDTGKTVSSAAEIKKLERFWNYDLRQQDYFCSQLTVVIELQSSALTIAVGKVTLKLPVDWFVIVCDKMTGSIDTIKVHELTNTSFKLFVIGPTYHTVTETGYRVIDFDQSTTFFHPVLGKHQLLCTEVNPGKWILVSPNDSYQKYLKNMALADFLM